MLLSNQWINGSAALATVIDGSADSRLPRFDTDAENQALELHNSYCSFEVHLYDLEMPPSCRGWGRERDEVKTSPKERG